MLCGGDPITGIMAAVGIAATMASVTATGNPLGLLGLLGPLTAGLGSFAGPALSGAATLGTNGVNAAGQTITNTVLPNGLTATAIDGVMPGLSTAAATASGLPSSVIAPAAADGMLGMVGGAVPAATAAGGSSAALQAASAAGSQIPSVANMYNKTVATGTTAPTQQPGPPPTSQPNTGNAPAGSSGNYNPNLPPPPAPKPSFAEKMGNFLWGKAPDPKMFGDDPQGRMLGAIAQMQYESQKGAMQRSLLSGGLSGLASMTSGLLEDDKYKPDYTYTKKGTAKTPRQMQRMSALGPPSHTDLLKRIGFKGNA